MPYEVVSFFAGLPKRFQVVFLRRRFFIIILGLSLLLCLGPSKKSTSRPAKGSPAFSSQPLRFDPNYGKLALAFEPNQGQTDPRVKILTRGSGYSLFITSQETVLSLKNPKTLAPQ